MSSCEDILQGNIQYIFLSSFNNFERDLPKHLRHSYNMVSFFFTSHAKHSDPAHRQHSQGTNFLEIKSQDSCCKDGLLLASAPYSAASRENKWKFLLQPSIMKFADFCLNIFIYIDSLLGLSQIFNSVLFALIKLIQI